MRIPICIILYFICATSYACGCKELDLAAVSEKSKTIFTAKITSQTIITAHEFSRVASEFLVLKKIKGDASSIKRIISNTSSNTCWKPLLTGEEYMFFTSSESEIEYSKCSPHQHIGPGNVAL